MSSKIKHFGTFSIVDGDVHVKVSYDRFTDQYKRAQYELDGAVMNSMVPFMPMISGSFINATRAASASVQGSGQVFAAYGPQGRFFYEGKGMVDEVTGSPWAARGNRKVLVSQYGGKTQAKEFLSYTKQAHPQAQSHWFDAAKKADGKMWIEKVKQIAGGGRRGG